MWPRDSETSVTECVVCAWNNTRSVSAPEVTTLRRYTNLFIIIISTSSRRTQATWCDYVSQTVWQLCRDQSTKTRASCCRVIMSYGVKKDVPCASIVKENHTWCVFLQVLVWRKDTRWGGYDIGYWEVILAERFTNVWTFMPQSWTFGGRWCNSCDSSAVVPQRRAGGTSTASRWTSWRWSV